MHTSNHNLRRVTGTAEPSVARAVGWLRRAQYESGFIVRFATAFRRIDVYPEITGYAISTFTKLFSKYGDPDFLDRALRAANAACRVMQTNGAIPSNVSTDGSYEDKVYLFDQGILAKGLLDLATHLANSGSPEAPRLLAQALKATDFISDAIDGAGPCNQYRLDGSPLDRFSYAFFAKCNLALLAAHRLTADERHFRTAQVLTRLAINGYQSSNGAFSVSAGSPFNRTHYHCYALEGLAEFHRATGDDDCLGALVRGAEYLATHQRADGSFPNIVFPQEDDGLEDVPVAAQAANIWRYLDGLGAGADRTLEISRAIGAIRRRQYRSRWGTLDGGFPLMVPGSLVRRRLACSWACIFYIDADVYDA